MPMAKAILTLKRVVESALSETLMGDNGRGPEEICSYTTFLRIELRDSAFSKREGSHMWPNDG
jgi:hypothetical protein